MSVMTPRTDVPAWDAVLAVVAHPDDESFGLGAILDAYVQAGSRVVVMCLTQGEASTIEGASDGLAAVRAAELRNAGVALGVQATELWDHPDGGLHTVVSTLLIDEISSAVTRHGATGLVVFASSGITGHPDHIAATEAAVAAAERVDLPVLAWTLPRAVADQLNEEFGAPFVGHDAADIDLVRPVTRDRQRAASLEHASQAIPTSVLWRRLELLGDREHLGWLSSPHGRGR